VAPAPSEQPLLILESKAFSPYKEICPLRNNTQKYVEEN
jgi:hypothetical protein